MIFKAEIVHFSDIDAENDQFCITTKNGIDDLVKSVNAVGVINPPILFENNDGFQIVSGFRRVAACRALDIHSGMCRVMDPSATLMDCAILAVADNTSQRPLNRIEEANGVNLLAQYAADDAYLYDILAGLGLPTGPSYVEKMTAIHALPVFIKRGMLEGRISLAAALKMMDLGETDAILLSRIFGKFNLSLNKQLEILTLVREILVKDAISMESLFQEPDLQQILADDHPENKGGAGEFRSVLKKRRFPEIHKMEHAFEKAKGSLKLPNHIHLVPPRHFESTVYSLRMDFSTAEDFEQCRNIMDRLAASPELKGILE